MIKNDKQYKVTSKRLTEFKQALKDLEKDQSKDPLLKQIEIDGVRSFIEEFENDIREYELLKDTNLVFICVDSIEAMRDALVKARIAKGWSQTELAERLELQPQQIQRYESLKYSTASMERIQQISEALELEIQPFKVFLGRSFNFSPTIDKETIERGKKFQERRRLIELN